MVATVVTSVAELGLGLVPVLVVASVTGTTSGWSAPLALSAVSGVYGMSAAALDCFVSPNCARMDRYVREGELDLLLMRPVRTGFLAAVRWVAPSELAAVLPGAGLLVTGLLLAGARPGAADLALGAGWAVVGTLAFALLWLNLSYLAFWMDGSEPVRAVVLSLRTAGQYPRLVLPPGRCAGPGGDGAPGGTARCRAGRGAAGGRVSRAARGRGRGDGRGGRRDRAALGR